MKYILGLLSALALALVGVLVGLFIGKQSYVDANTDKLEEIIDLVANNYVDTLNPSKLEEDAIAALLSQLDPHSTYIPAQDLERANEDLMGGFGGVGIEFNVLQDTLVVVTTVQGGPSEQLGILSGDKIIKVGNESIAGVKISNEKIMSLLRGPQGTTVNVTILRQGKILDYTIKRDLIPIHTIEIAYMIAPQVGYIKINSFGAETYDDFVTSIKGLKAQGMKALVLDLRDNPGGYLDAAVNIADEMLEDHKTIVYTQGVKYPKEVFEGTSSKQLLEQTKLYVLINEGSASASEIVAGALQDNDKGIVIGRRSFGKGLVQRPFKLSDGSEVRLTIARYYTPTGRCIQRPYEKGDIEGYYRELLQRYEGKDTLKLPADTLVFKTPKGKIVYGGGGIKPDLEIPFDTTDRTVFVFEVLRQNMLNDFTLNFADQHRMELKKCSTLAQITNYLNAKGVYEQFLNYAQSKGLTPKSNDKLASKPYLQNQIEAKIVKIFLDKESYYKTLNQGDRFLKKAMDLVQP